MKIKKIHVNNYRMLKDFDFDFEDELSIVIGKNNCGKTSLLSILEKFIGVQSTSNNFAYDDFNNDFQDSLYSAIKDNEPSWDSIPIKGIELFIYIEYDENDNLSNLQPLMLDLNPDNNIVIIKFEYTLTEIKLHKIKEDFDKYIQRFNKSDKNRSQNSFDTFMKTRHKKYFTVYRKAVLYDEETKQASKTEYSVLESKDWDLNKIICFRCISARRDTVNKEGDSTLSQLSNHYYEKTKSKEETPEVIIFEDKLQETDEALTEVYEGLFKDVINKVKRFGGIRENETAVKIISTLSKQQLLKGNTTVVYTNNNHELPESYNGLGYLNLISMIMEIEIYLREFLKVDDEIKSPANINLLFIEEPEAHTHPQLQYIFIKNIKNLLLDSISDEDKRKLINLQTVITTHSSHIVSECDFDDIKYLRRYPNENIISKNLKELEISYKDETDPYNSHFKFLKQYLTLNCAEIFFADKVILFEGETERILLPAMLKKIDEDYPLEDKLPMLSQNISLITSGAYSQIFDQFLYFVGIKTLIITDIDSGIKEETNIDGKKKTNICKRPVKEGTHTSNSALKHYYQKPLQQYIDDEKGSELQFFTTMTKENKTLKKIENKWVPDSDGNLMLIYQTEEDGYYPRSFEDAFIQINRQFLIDNQETYRSLKNLDNIDKKDSNENNFYDAYSIAKNCIKSKSSFALDVLLHSSSEDGHTFSNWKIPSYIKEGLLWLRED